MQRLALILEVSTLVHKRLTFTTCILSSGDMALNLVQMYSAPEQESQLLKVFIESFLSLKRVKYISLTVLSEKEVI